MPTRVNASEHPAREAARRLQRVSDDLQPIIDADPDAVTVAQVARAVQRMAVGMQVVIRFVLLVAKRLIRGE